jgi:Family of unknown function (DUF6152)
MNVRIALWALVASCASLPAAAHHSIAAVYDSSRPRTLEGVVTQFAFIHPHPFIVLEVREGTAPPQSWRLEMDNRFELAEIGVTAETFKAGDRIIVSGSPGRAQPLTLYIRRLDRPRDGFEYEQAGASPRINAPSR